MYEGLLFCLDIQTLQLGTPLFHPTEPFRPGSANGRNGAKPEAAEHRHELPLSADCVEKVEKSSVTKTRQTAIRWNIAAQHHLRPVEDGARCPIDKLAGPPADFLNAAPIGLPENRISPKGSFSTQSPLKRRCRRLVNRPSWVESGSPAASD